MQYPLETLYFFVNRTLHPKHVVKRLTNAGGIAFLAEELKALKEKAKLDICECYTTSQNSIQSYHMQKSLLACLYDLHDTIMKYRKQPNPQIESEGLAIEINECYYLVTGCVEDLLDFLHNYFEPLRPVHTLDTPYQINGAARMMITTSLSVPQVAFFVKLMVDAGIISEDNITSLTQAASLNIKTKKTGQISPESLRNKYYSPEKHTIEIVQEYVKRMQQRLMRYR